MDADIRGSQAFARALERVGILTGEECQRIVTVFEEIRKEPVDANAADEDTTLMSFASLKEHAGAVADKIHTPQPQ